MVIILNNKPGYFNVKNYRQVTGTRMGIKPAPTPERRYFYGILGNQPFYKLNAKLGFKVASYFWNRYDDGVIFWDKRLCNFDCIFEV